MNQLSKKVRQFKKGKEVKDENKNVSEGCLLIEEVHEKAIS